MNDELVIFIGDDTGGTFGRKLEFTISVEEGASLDGCSAEFVFDGITRTFAGPLVDGETREIVYSADETAKMAKGVRYASFRVIDANGKVRTFTNTIRVRCTDIVAEVYPGTSGISITIGGGSVAWNDITGKPNFAPVATSGSYNDLTDKPTIPQPVTIDNELSTTSENPVQNKVVTAALNGKATAAQGAKADAALSRAEAVAGFTEWSVSPSGEGYFSWQISWTNGEWVATNPNMGTKTMSGDSAHDPSATSLQFDGLVEDVQYTATRTRLPTMADVNAKLDKADVVTPSLDVATGKAADAQKTALGLNLLNQGKADASALPYALSAAEVIAEGTTDEPNDTITYGLADRTINGISTPSGKKYVNIVMPAVSVAGHARDLVVRLAVGAADLNITWGVDDVGGVAVDYETEDGEFPDLSEAGTYLVRLTETAAFVAGTGGTADVPAKFLIQCQPLQTAVAGGAA